MSRDLHEETLRGRQLDHPQDLTSTPTISATPPSLNRFFDTTADGFRPRCLLQPRIIFELNLIAHPLDPSLSRLVLIPRITFYPQIYF